MVKLNITKTLLCGVGLLGLGGCSLASLPGGYMPIEKQAVRDLNTANYTPRSAQERAAILTQDLFAQAAFWSREYDLNPADLEAAVNLANTLRRLDNPYKAIEVAQTTRALYPRNVELMIELAAAYIASNKPNQALPIIDNALGQRQDIARLWSLKGAVLDQFEQFDQARQHYSKALSLAPNDPGIIGNVGLSYALEGDPKTAEIWLRRAASMPGASPSVRQNLSLVLGLQNKFDEAETWAARDLGQEAASNNMSYLRQLRSAKSPQTTRVTPTPQTYTRPQTYNKQTANSSASLRQTALAGRTGYQMQSQYPVAPTQIKRPSALVQNTNPYGQMAKPADNLNMISGVTLNNNGSGRAPYIAPNAARAIPLSSPQKYGQPVQLRSNPSNPAPRSQEVPRVQNVLGRIARYNTPKTTIAQQQRQQLAARAQNQYQYQSQYQSPVQQRQANQYQNGYVNNQASPMRSLPFVQPTPHNVPTRSGGPATHPATYYGQVGPAAQPTLQPGAPTQSRTPARQRRR